MFHGKGAIWDTLLYNVDIVNGDVEQCHAFRWEQFCTYVVLDRVNMASRDENSILDQIYEKQIFLDLYYEN